MSLTQEEIEAGLVNDQIGTQLVLETDTMRVWHLRLKPGENIPAHRHDRPYFWTVLSDGKGLSHFADGKEAEIIYRSGDTKHFSDLNPHTGFVHDLTNVGDSELIFVTIEFHSPSK